ncbi:MAG: hypothetical protein P8144_03940 [Gammaproteobacteria bacterium]
MVAVDRTEINADAATSDSHLDQSRVVVFTDLDDSILLTKSNLPQGAHYFLGASDQRGQPHSFFTASLRRLLQLFQDSNAIIIPATGRSTEALNRVNYAFSSYCVVSHGAVVLNPDGHPCKKWLGEIESELEHWPELLDHTNREINHIISTENLDARSRVIVDQNIPAYVSIKGQPSALEHIRLRNTLDPHFFRHENGRNHALLPPYTRKRRAIHYIQRKLKLSANDLAIGIGDSLSDLEFLQACQFAMIPKNSQIMGEHLLTEA